MVEIMRSISSVVDDALLPTANKAATRTATKFGVGSGSGQLAAFGFGALYL